MLNRKISHEKQSCVIFLYRQASNHTQLINSHLQYCEFLSFILIFEDVNFRYFFADLHHALIVFFLEQVKHIIYQSLKVLQHYCEVVVYYISLTGLSLPSPLVAFLKVQSLLLTHLLLTIGGKVYHEVKVLNYLLVRFIIDEERTTLNFLEKYLLRLANVMQQFNEYLWVISLQTIPKLSLLLMVVLHYWGLFVIRIENSLLSQWHYIFLYAKAFVDVSLLGNQFRGVGKLVDSLLKNLQTHRHILFLREEVSRYNIVGDGLVRGEGQQEMYELVGYLLVGDNQVSQGL